MAVPARLCDACRVLQDVHALLQPGVPGQMPYIPTYCLRVRDTWPDLPRLANSGLSGCDFCRILHKRLVSTSDVRPWDADDDPEVTIDVFPIIDDVLIYTSRDSNKPQFICGFVVYLCPKRSDMDVFREVKFLACLDAREAKANLAFLPAPTAEVLSDRNLSFAKTALERCSLTCEHVELTNFLPTRLLDLGDDLLGKRSIRLVLTDGIIKSPQIKARTNYAALSYCWGNREAALLQPKTTTTNLDYRMSNIDLEEMSPVVRDAIQVCSKLDIRYLWVDALCILQGNDDTAVEDWNHESQQMAKIFKSALVTLCAASSTSCKEGFLHERRVQTGPSLHIQPRTDNDAAFVSTKDFYTYSIIPCGPDSIDINYYRLDSFPFHKQIDASRWYGRGWVHQEMRLSSRLLVFTSDWLFFMCDGLYLCENGLSVTREWRTPLAVGTCKADMQEEPFAAFASEIETFTAKDFTFDTDRLPALASLASMIAANTGSQYLAGLWRDNLDKDLLFARNVPRYGTRGMVSFQKRIAALSAPGSVIRPSWSWAGLTGPCDAGPPSLTATTRLALQCEVAHVEFSAMGNNPFGRPRTAKLVLRTGTVPLTRLTHGKPADILDGVLAAHIHQHVPGGLGLGIFVGWDTDNKDVTYSEADKMFLVQISRHEGYGPRGGYAAGLIVYPAEVEGEYYRVGLWYTNTGFGWDMPWESRVITLV